MKQKMFLTAAALVLLFVTACTTREQVGNSELDPNILWVADSSIGRIDGFAVHPNGNIFAYKGNLVSEINGADGKLIRKFSIPNQSISSIDISDDGKFLATSYSGVFITDLLSDESKEVGFGGGVTFIPHSNKIVYGGIGGSTGHDSSIVILDLVTDQRTYIKTEEGIHKIAFSPDGRFFATGGSLYTGGFIPSYTTLKLWDAQTNKLIKELERTVNTNYDFQKIEFSNNSKLVAFLPYNGQVSIYNSENTTLFRKYDENISPFKSFGKFCFINDSLIAFTSIIGPSTFLWNYINEKAYNIVNYLAQRGLNYSNALKAIIIGTNTQLIAYDLNKILSSVNHKSKNTIIQASY